MSSSACSACCRPSSSSSPAISASTTPFPSTSKFKPVLRTKPHATIPKMSLDPRDFHSPAPQPPPPSSSSSLLAAVAALLWGPSLPPGLLVSSVRSAWTAAWRLMMSQLAPSDPSGRYARPASRFRLAGPSGLPGPRRPGALHLYVGLPCPWAHRALVVRALKGLEDAVPVSVASPGVDGSWEFRDPPGPERGDLAPGRDRVNGCRNLREVYRRRRGGYSGRCTVPMLWDVDRSDVACNESYDIIRVLNSGLNGLARHPEVDLAPPELEAEIEEWNRVIYPGVNNGVYRCGFAQSQEGYDAAVTELFRTLDMLDDHLSRSRYLCGDKLTLADVCLFTTLVRFDPVYNVLFKCTKKKLVEYPSLHGYMRDIYQVPKVAATCDFDAIMDGYYRFLFPLNPGNIKPIMPSAFAGDALFEPHGRERLSSQSRGTLVSS
ncbi:hypothetical protein EUGRSUZ_K01434 [Eucalyptus grandis]|uniref:Uncharacterized protein n=2 Tax=Eucalyptus grandis TaxID=71139 RepID=A0ACC3ITD9_EUCGR|nr:hypothetical protein EUGRSUZ_K01434 [Eucalyptus grandis]